MTQPILEHFSSAPLQPPRDFAQPGPELYGKPRGLWVSARGEDDWLKWCTGEEFRFDALACRTLVHLAPDANILTLRSAEAIRQFHDEFGTRDPRMIGCGSAIMERDLCPDWSAVAARYDGIVIAPYQWSLRLDDSVRWYYTWDCASGCIWHAKAIDRLELIEPPKFSIRKEVAV